MYDIEQVEVLKGPQGALYGRNASGGAINIMTRQPTNELEGFARAGFGNGENKGFIGSVSGALVPNVLLGRAAVSFKDADGWRENITLGQKADSVCGPVVSRQAAVATGATVSGDLRFAYSNTEALPVPVRLERAQFRRCLRRWADCRAPPRTSAAGATARRRCCRACLPSIATLVGDPNNTSVQMQGNIPGVDEREVTTISGKIDWQTGSARSPR